MAQVINTNSLSLITQNNINKNQSALSTSIERLSSGLRINSAKDDAAGQAIANRFTSNIKGLTQAARNANDGISLAQTTEGALSEINNNLQRVRELTVQATTGTNSESDLSSIQDEIKSRLSEIDRVSGQTQFNGVNVLAKSGSMKIQVGANDGQTISIDLKKIDSSTLGLKGFSVEGNTAVKTSDAIKTQPAAATTLPATVPIDTDSVDDAVAGIGGLETGASSAGVFAADDGKYYVKVEGNTTDPDKNGYYLANIGDNSTDTTNAGKVTIAAGTTPVNETGIDFGSPITNVANTATTAPAPDVNVTFATDANTAAIKDATLVKLQDANGKDTNTYAIKDADGNLYATDGPDATGKVAVKTVAYNDAKGDEQTATVKLGGDDGKTGVVTLGTGTDAKTYVASDIEGKDLSDDATELTAIATKTGRKTADPLAALDDAIAQVDKFRSSLGAVQNQLDSAVTNLNNTTTNLSEAQSRIQDADYATEVSNMSKAQIIQQAGNSVLAKANQVPQQILSLLQG